eukprot:scaffold9824_cov82-Attheya_sp.AAC.1
MQGRFYRTIDARCSRRATTGISEKDGSTATNQQPPTGKRTPNIAQEIYHDFPSWLVALLLFLLFNNMAVNTCSFFVKIPRVVQ